jgi:hypothetical protein
LIPVGKHVRVYGDEYDDSWAHLVVENASGKLVYVSPLKAYQADDPPPDHVDWLRFEAEWAKEMGVQFSAGRRSTPLGDREIAADFRVVPPDGERATCTAMSSATSTDANGSVQPIADLSPAPRAALLPAAATEPVVDRTETTTEGSAHGAAATSKRGRPHDPIPRASGVREDGRQGGASGSTRRVFRRRGSNSSRTYGLLTPAAVPDPFSAEGLPDDEPFTQSFDPPTGLNEGRVP